MCFGSDSPEFLHVALNFFGKRFSNVLSTALCFVCNKPHDYRQDFCFISLTFCGFILSWSYYKRDVSFWDYGLFLEGLVCGVVLYLLPNLFIHRCWLIVCSLFRPIYAYWFTGMISRINCVDQFTSYNICQPISFSIGVAQDNLSAWLKKSVVLP